LLEARHQVFRNRGNLNNHIGLPLSLSELKSGPDVAVVELGMNHKGEISTLVALAEPEIRVWTNVGNAHIGFFESREAI
ncbi:Mur ligase family protein, partial [Salmonella enterica subsp. enterica serovar Minnesota]|uniref:Mur ligase family protein n=1 Tax=Salmonella enterica TaxID=28901 RepID=UPI003D295767